MIFGHSGLMMKNPTYLKRLKFELLVDNYSFSRRTNNNRLRKDYLLPTQRNVVVEYSLSV